MNPPRNAEHQVLGTKGSKEKNPTALFLKKGWIVYVTWIGIWELSYAALSLWSFAVTNGQTCDALFKKGGFVYVVLVGYINFSCNAPKSADTKRSKEKNPTDPIMIVVRFSNRCELLTLEIYFLESV